MGTGTGVGGTYESHWGRRYCTRGLRGGLTRGVAVLWPRGGGDGGFSRLEIEEEQAGPLGHVGREAGGLASC
jgi:hypothetical protein